MSIAALQIAVYNNCLELRGYEPTGPHSTVVVGRWRVSSSGVFHRNGWGARRVGDGDLGRCQEPSVGSAPSGW